jgi:hypothetical protein
MQVAIMPGAMRIWATMLARAHADPAFGAASRARFFTPAREAFRRVIASGEIAADTDVELALDLTHREVGESVSAAERSGLARF